jgi:mono/diheme cytochrome c family protein
MKHGKQQKRQKKRSPLGLLLLILLWSAVIGWGGAVAMDNRYAELQLPLSTQSGQSVPASSWVFKPLRSSANTLSQTHPKSVDPVPDRLQLGMELYRDRCGSCHLAIPPEVFPTQTWQQLLQNPQDHYGTTLKSIIRPELLIMWDYVSRFSRPLEEDETTPYRFGNSRYFKILHPRVDLPNPISHATCASCHPAAREFDFRYLAPEWEDAP